MTTVRKAIHAYVSDDAMTGWNEFSIENGISVTSIVEILGLDFRSTHPDDWGDLVKRARRVDAERRRRG